MQLTSNGLCVVPLTGEDNDAHLHQSKKHLTISSVDLNKMKQFASNHYFIFGLIIIYIACFCRERIFYINSALTSLFVHNLTLLHGNFLFFALGH